MAYNQTTKPSLSLFPNYPDAPIPFLPSAALLLPGLSAVDTQAQSDVFIVRSLVVAEGPSFVRIRLLRTLLAFNLRVAHITGCQSREPWVS